MARLSGCRCVTNDGPCDAVVGIGSDGLCAYCREMHDLNDWNRPQHHHIGASSDPPNNTTHGQL